MIHGIASVAFAVAKRGTGVNADAFTRTSLGLAMQAAIGKSRIDKIRYSVTQWEVTFQGVEESLLCASELIIVNSTLRGFGVHAR
jgi:hypothetical protein